MSEVPSKPKFNIHQCVTEKIIARIEAGLEGHAFCAPWHAPAGAMALPVNAATHALYRGVNIVSLWIESQVRGYASAYWASYRQWQGMGAQVRKGERGSMVVFYKRIETQAFEDEDHDQRGDLRFVARASTIFNASQVDGFVDDTPALPQLFQRIEEAEACVSAVGAVVRHGCRGACYRPREDVIEMPNREWFVASTTSTVEEQPTVLLAPVIECRFADPGLAAHLQCLFLPQPAPK